MEDEAPGLLKDMLGPTDLSELFALGVTQTYPARRTIFAEGSSGDTVLLIARGRVEISRTALTGRRTILAQTGPGDVVGELAALDGRPRSADAVAATEVSGHMLMRSQVMAFLTERPGLVTAVIACLCARLRQTNATLTDQALSDGQTRLARCLMRLFDRWARADRSGALHLDQRFSQSDLGDMTGLSRESVNRYLGAFEAGNILDRSQGQLVLLAPDALRRIAGPDL